VLTLDIWSNSSYLCQNLRPPSPLPSVNSTDGTYCPVAAGPFAFSSTIPLGNNRELTTLITQLHAVDPSGNDLVCLNIFTTPLDPQPHSLYGKANIIFWSTIALTVVYWVVIGIARIASAWGRGITRPGRGIWSRAQSAGFILASAVSGERLATSPALMHFCMFFDLIAILSLILGRHAVHARCYLPYSVVCPTCHGGGRVAAICVYVINLKSRSIFVTSIHRPTLDTNRLVDAIV
jgi:hypothetical protein